MMAGILAMLSETKAEEGALQKTMWRRFTMKAAFRSFGIGLGLISFGLLISKIQLELQLTGAGILIAALRFAVPVLILQFKLRNAKTDHIELVVTTALRRKKKALFYLVSLGIVLLSFHPDVFLPFVLIVLVILALLFIPLILNNRIWEVEEDDEAEEYVWRA